MAISGARRARPTQHHAQLAEEIARSEPCHDPFSRRNLAYQLDLAGLDHVDVIAGFALVEDRLTRHERPLVVTLKLDLGVRADAHGEAPL